MLKEDIPGPVASVETETLDPNGIDIDASTNIGITHTTVVCNYSNAPTPIFYQSTQHLRPISMRNLMMRMSTVTLMVMIVMIIMMHYSKYNW